MLGLLQHYQPVACEGHRCGYIFQSGSHRQPIRIPWVETDDGRVLWYLFLCPRCWESLPEHTRWRAVNPPYERPPREQREAKPSYLRPVPAPESQAEESKETETDERIRDDSVRRKRWGTGGPRRWHRNRPPDESDRETA
jgi:hypothetical protein